MVKPALPWWAIAIIVFVVLLLVTAALVASYKHSSMPEPDTDAMRAGIIQNNFSATISVDGSTFTWVSGDKPKKNDIIVVQPYNSSEDPFTVDEVRETSSATTFTIKNNYLPDLVADGQIMQTEPIDIIILPNNNPLKTFSATISADGRTFTYVSGDKPKKNDLITFSQDTKGEGARPVDKVKGQTFTIKNNPYPKLIAAGQRMRTEAIDFIILPKKSMVDKLRSAPRPTTRPSCGANEYSRGNKCKNCPLLSTSLPGSTSILQCKCPQNYQLRHNTCVRRRRGRNVVLERTF